MSFSDVAFDPFQDYLKCGPHDDPSLTQTTIATCVFNDDTVAEKKFDGWFEGLKDGIYSIQSPGGKSYCSYY